MAKILKIRELSVSFFGFQAIKSVTTDVEEHDIHFFIGPNGAGKTTILDMICGRTRPTSGSIQFAGHDLAKMSEVAIAGLGVGRKFQAPSVFPGITIQENMELAAMNRRSLYATMFRKLSAEKSELIEQTLEEIGLRKLRNEYPTRLSHGQKQWLEIGMLFVSQPKLLLLDEPVAGMGRAETEKTARFLQRIAKQSTVMVVDHDMEFVRDCSTRVTVLHEGAILDEGTIDKVQNNPKVIDVYLGRGGEIGA